MLKNKQANKTTTTKHKPIKNLYKKLQQLSNIETQVKCMNGHYKTLQLLAGEHMDEKYMCGSAETVNLVLMPKSINYHTSRSIMQADLYEYGVKYCGTL